MTKQDLTETLKLYNIDVISFRKRGDRYFAELGSDHRINGEWWEDVVRKHYPIAYSTTGYTIGSLRQAEYEGVRQCVYKMRVL